MQQQATQCPQLDVCDPVTVKVIVEEEHYSFQQFAKYYSIGEFKPDTNKREFSMFSEFRLLEMPCMIVLIM